MSVTSIILKVRLSDFLPSPGTLTKPPPFRATLSLGLEKRFLLPIMVARFTADGQGDVTFPVMHSNACTTG